MDTLGRGKYVRTPEMRAAQAARSRLQVGKRAEQNHQWKGEDAGYTTKHTWASRTFGTPRRCEHCASESEKRYDWANVSGQYKRERADWLRLCRRCHTRYDRAIRLKKNKRYEFNGESLTLTEWSERLNFDYYTLYRRLHRLGWSMERALSQPIIQKPRKQPWL